MKLKIAAIFAAVLICIEMAVGFYVLDSFETKELNIAEVNDLVQISSKGWENILQGDTGWLPSSEYSYGIFDSRGGRLYASMRDVPETIEQGLKNKDVTFIITKDRTVLGTLLIKNEDSEYFREAKWRIFTYVTAGGAAMATLFLMYCLYLRHTFFAPFEKLERFAARIAKGNLDMPLTMDKKNVFGVFTESFDIMREELKKAREKEWEAQRSKKELVAKLSHDIKTPIASIKAVAEVMSVQAEEEKMKSQLAVIEAKANQVDALISNLFHATLEELQELCVNPTEVSSAAIFDIILSADYKGKAKIGEMPQCLVYMDELRLQQVFDNVFANSYKYADTRMLVSFGIEGKMLNICCRDFGPGVLKEEEPLLKNKYFRGTYSEGKNGAGLGLYISAYLMKQMGGALVCRNSEDGFEVVICLKI